MPARRSHKKSRAGCGNCKRRRIKCDEVHPTCTNCTKHAIACDYSQAQQPVQSATADPDSEAASPSPSGATASPAPTTTSNSSSSRPRIPPIAHPPPSHPSSLPPPAPALASLSRAPEDLLSCPVTLPPINDSFPIRPPHLPPVFQYDHSPVPPPPPPSDAYSILDISLMHHYTLYTASTISNRPEIISLWRHQIPLLASQNPFLMHALLAVSALHLHYLSPSPSPSLLSAAQSHHDRAVRGMAQTLANIDKDNCNALVSASCLVVIYAFVSSRLDPAPGEGELAAWMPLLRGVHSILKQSYVWVTVTGGPLQYLIKQYIIPHPPPLDPSTDAVLSSLYRLCTDRSLPGSDELDDTDIAAAYFAAIAELRKSYATVNEWENIIGSIFTWPITVSDRFVALLVERRKRALVIFVFYCGLFVGLESFWWSRGSAMWEMERVERWLGPEWEEWTRWPKQRILEKARADSDDAHQKADQQGSFDPFAPFPPPGFPAAAAAQTAGATQNSTHSPTASTSSSSAAPSDPSTSASGNMSAGIGRGGSAIPEGPIPFDKTGLGAPWGMMREGLNLGVAKEMLKRATSLQAGQGRGHEEGREAAQEHYHQQPQQQPQQSQYQQTEEPHHHHHHHQQQQRYQQQPRQQLRESPDRRANQDLLAARHERENSEQQYRHVNPVPAQGEALERDDGQGLERREPRVHMADDHPQGGKEISPTTTPLMQVVDTGDGAGGTPTAAAVTTNVVGEKTVGVGVDGGGGGGEKGGI